MVSSQIRIRIAEPSINNDDVKSVASAVSSGWVSGRGKYVDVFERDYGEWLGGRNVISCSSGTAALHLALASLNLKGDEEVIIPAFSMGAIPFAVSYTRAKMVLIDSEPVTWNMDTTQLERRITSRTKAVVVMHTYGHPVDLKQVLNLCRAKGITVIEDASEAHGAEYRGRRVGSLGDMSCFSFYANKLITTGEGGCVVTRDHRLAEKIRVLRDMAFSTVPSKRFLHDYIGFSYRMTNMQAALGTSQLKRIGHFMAIRRRNAHRYNRLLARVNGIITPREAKWAKSVYWMYSVLVSAEYGMSRDRLMLELSKRGIETRPFFVPVHLQPVFKSHHTGERYPVAERLSKYGLNLPSGNTLTEGQVEYVATTIAAL